MIDVRAYWPQPETGRQLLVQDATKAWGPEVFSVLRRYQRGTSPSGQAVLQKDEYIAPGGWISGWDYRIDPVHGVIETANRYPGIYQAYKAGKWIVWGGVMTVGQTVQQGIEVDLSRSTGVSVNPGNYGWQSVTLEAVHPAFTNDGGLAFVNVAQIKVFQSWCVTAACAFPSGQTVYEMRYWLAPSVGIIQVDYLVPDLRRDYARHVVTTVVMPNVD